MYYEIMYYEIMVINTSKISYIHHRNTFGKLHPSLSSKQYIYLTRPKPKHL